MIPPVRVGPGYALAVVARLEPIRSSSNPLLKRVRRAASARGAGGADEILLEGDRLVDDAHAAGLELLCVLVDEERSERMARLEEAGLPVRAVRGSLLAAAGTLESSPGCLALARTPAPRALSELGERDARLVVAAAGVQDPGNLGALARTAEAAGANALLVTPGGCRPWNPKALRGSMGSLLRLAVHEIEPGVESVERLAGLGFRHVCARTRGGVPYDRFDWGGRVVLWLSAESGGFPEGLAGPASRFEGVSIPMHAGAESLNVTAAAAVLLFAARRAGGAS